VLRSQAAARPDAIYLDAPDEAKRWTFAEVQWRAESVASTLLDSGLEYGDRVLIQAGNSSGLLFTWFGAAVASGPDPAWLRTMSDVPGTSRLSPSPTCWLSPIGRNWPGLGRPGIGGFTDQRHQRDGPPDACP
jgi:hypothetical protein